jgi:ADP-heptose:LPS heptosyltransferase
MSKLLRTENPVAFFVNGIGDHILTLPSVRALTALFPYKLTLVCDSSMHELFFADLPLGRVVEVKVEDEVKVEGGSIRRFDACQVTEAIGSCDLFLSLVPWHSPSMTALLQRLNPALSVGFFSDFDVSLQRDYSKHSADLAFDVPYYLKPSLKMEDYASPPIFPRSAQRWACQLRELIPPSMRMLVVHADTASKKMWQVDRFIAVLDSFLERQPNFLVFVVGTTYQPLDQGYYGNRVFLCYGLSLAVSLCIVAQADLFLGIDSCMLHAADFCRVPGVGLFGVTGSEEFGFRVGPHRHVCGNGSMDTIQVDRVLDAMQSLSFCYN